MPKPPRPSASEVLRHNLLILVGLPSPVPLTGVVIEWTWRWYVDYYIYKGKNLLSVVVCLTCLEIGKSVVSRVNNDVTLGPCLS